MHDHTLNNMITDLWLPNCKKWDESKIIALFGQHTLHVLLQIPLVMGDAWPSYFVLEISL